MSLGALRFHFRVHRVSTAGKHKKTVLNGLDSVLGESDSTQTLFQ